MDWLNYNHLLYFWTVAREGTVAAAAEHLGLAQPTISAQIRLLENALGQKLFQRSGRNLVLTEHGRVAFRFADEIFSLGREMVSVLHGHPGEAPLRLQVGVADVLPKLVASRLLAPAFSLEDPLQVTCYEGKPADLLTRLSVHELDVVLSDAPLGPEVRVRAFNHHLGDCAVTIFGVPSLAAAYRRNFPESLDDAPMLLPTGNTMLRRALDHWFEEQRVRPQVVAEFEDSALMKACGASGIGLFVSAAVIAGPICHQYGVEVVGELAAVREHFYAISGERKVKNPAVLAITSAARDHLFGRNATLEGEPE